VLGVSRSASDPGGRRRGDSPGQNRTGEIPLRKKIEEQLLFEPRVETKNRKPLRQPAPLASEVEIRFGPDNRFRVLYEVHEDERAVHVLAIGEKEGNRLLIGGEEVGL
jgi:hypothetical protein